MRRTVKKRKCFLGEFGPYRNMDRMKGRKGAPLGKSDNLGFKKGKLTRIELWIKSKKYELKTQS
jgi:hypothetical protein